MDQHRRQLTSALFTLITEKLEDAIPLATKGQDVKLTAVARKRLACTIIRLGDELGDLGRSVRLLDR